MRKKADQPEQRGKGKTRKLKLKKETAKDLDPQDPSGVKGGVAFISDAGCAPTGGCHPSPLTLICPKQPTK